MLDANYLFQCAFNLPLNCPQIAFIDNYILSGNI